MKKIRTTEAVGHVLCHDLTRIVGSEYKDAAFRRGHIVREEDVPLLLSMGKENLYVWECGEDMLHEDEAAQILAQICQGEHMEKTPVKEGKIELVAGVDGLLLVDTQALRRVNTLGEMMIATRHSGTAVGAGDKLAGTRIIPLLIERAKMEQALAVAGEKPLLRLIPFTTKRVGVVTTGSEVYHGRIQDTFTPVVEKKLEAYGMAIEMHQVCDDNPEKIANAIRQMRQKGMELVVCTGGMSVDPDDATPGGIHASGAQIVSYGAPVLPGAMFLLAYHNGVPVVGLPGCVMYAKATIFDLVLPFLAAEVVISREQLADLGHGGLCLGCASCSYPHCSFGKGGWA